MAAIFLRELVIVANRWGFPAAIAIHVAVLGAFAVVWGNGVPLLPGDSLFEQATLVQWMLLAVVLPWTAARCLAAGRPDDLVGLSVLSAVRPSHLVVARWLAAFCALAVLVMAGLPMAVLIQQISAIPLSRVLVGFAPVLGLSAFVATMALAWDLVRPDRLSVWMFLTASTLVVALGTAWLRLDSWSTAILLFVAAVLPVAVCAALAESSWKYLSEQRA